MDDSIEVEWFGEMYTIQFDRYRHYSGQILGFYLSAEKYLLSEMEDDMYLSSDVDEMWAVSIRLNGWHGPDLFTRKNSCIQNAIDEIEQKVCKTFGFISTGVSENV
jgi:hypothetical protein